MRIEEGCSLIFIYGKVERDVSPAGTLLFHLVSKLESNYRLLSGFKAMMRSNVFFIAASST